MRIKKAKLKDDALEVVYTERKPDGTVKTVTESHETKVHPDLVQSFENLKIHLAILCGFVALKQVKKIETPPEDLTENFHVRGISIKTGDDEGVVISGHFINPLTKKAVILNTPFQRYTEQEESAYKFTDDLIEKVERANAEVNSYLDGSKKAEEPQQAINFPETPAPQNRLPEDIESEDVDPNASTSEQIAQRLEDKEIWKDGKRPVAGTVAT